MLQGVQPFNDAMVNLSQDIFAGRLHSKPFLAYFRHHLPLFSRNFPFVILVASCAYIHMVKDQKMLAGIFVWSCKVEGQHIS